MTVLIDTLFMIESFLGIETDTLMPFAEADNLGGYHPDPSQRQWGAGAIWDVEGRTIYALVRALKPVNVVEIGSGTGCSTNHIASALLANSFDDLTHIGHVVTLDRGNTPEIRGEHNNYVTVVPGDAFEYLELLPDNSIDFILEDADHSEDMCYRVGEIAKRKLAPGGVLVAHDAAHFGVGADVRAGFERAGLQGRVYLTEPSDCGLLVWRKPDVSYDGMTDRTMVFTETKPNGTIEHRIDIDEPVLQAQEDKPKRKRKAAK
jgi:predicted O-methyltransferase YrrM